MPITVRILHPPSTEVGRIASVFQHPEIRVETREAPVENVVFIVEGVITRDVTIATAIAHRALLAKKRVI